MTPPGHAVWCRPDPSADWAFELLLNDTAGDDWVFRRDDRIRRPLTSIGGTTSEGIPFLAPEIVLLYKAKSRRPRDEEDLAHALPALHSDQRGWLAEALEIAHPGHAWIPTLRS